MRHRYIKQEGIKDCGVCTLYNIIKYHGGSINIEKLRRLTKTDENGTNVYNMVLASSKLGLKAKSYKCGLNDLWSLNFPSIAHLKFENNCYHFVIIDKIVDDEIIIFDPIRGILKYSMDDFSKEWTGIVITFKKTDYIVKEKELGYFKKILIYLSKYKKIIIYIFLISIICSLLSSINSFYFSNLYNYKNKSVLILIIFIIFLFLKISLDKHKSTILLNFSKTIDKKITNKVYGKIISLPIIFHHSRPVGDIVSRLNDLSYIKNFINEFSFSFLVDLIFTIVISIFLLILSKELFIILLFILIIYILSYLIIRSNIKYLSIINKENASLVNTFIMESILGIDTINNLNIRQDIYNKYNNIYGLALDNNIKFNRKIVNVNIFEDFITSFGTIIILFFGINFVKNGLITFSSLIAFNSLLIYQLSSIKNLIRFDNSIIEAKNSYKRINSILTNSEDEPTCYGLIFNKEICFKNVSYSYNQNYNVLNNISFKIEKGKYIFVRGESGIGKSTIFKLLTKQLKCEDNTIFIDNIDINKLSSKDITDNICYVSQNEYIFTDTIINNIKMYKEIDSELLRSVLSITMIDKILNDRNINLDFVLEENGHNLSGGERQKILLARTLLRGSNLLILDETMNEIDAVSERKIIEDIKKNFNFTLVLISHRNDNSDLFDEILTVKGE